MIWARFVAYGLFGWCAEIVWTALYAAVFGTRQGLELSREERWRLRGHTYLWMLPIYGSAALFFEPAHELLRAHFWPVRALSYMLGCFAVEALSGALLKWSIGRCPWDYSYSRWSALGGTIRLDYAPVWLTFGMLLERVHDLLRVIFSG
jgi:hypothetical protein